jgi:hypothetical protein
MGKRVGSAWILLSVPGCRTTSAAAGRDCVYIIIMVKIPKRTFQGSTKQPYHMSNISPLLANRLRVKRRALGEVVDPVEDLSVPVKRILRVEHMVVLVGEVEEARGYALRLEYVEQHQSVAFGETVVERVVHNKLGRAEVANVVQRIPLVVHRVRVRDAAVVVVPHKPELLGRVGALRVEDAVVRHNRFELPSKIVAVDPVGHESASGC